MIVVRFTLVIFTIAVMLRLLPAVIAGLLLLLCIQAVHSRRF